MEYWGEPWALGQNDPLFGVATLRSSNSEMNRSSTRLFFFGRSEVGEQIGSSAERDRVCLCEKTRKQKIRNGGAPDGGTMRKARKRKKNRTGNDTNGSWRGGLLRDGD
jgi:hypothetical protein